MSNENEKTCHQCGVPLIPGKKADGGNTTPRQLRKQYGYCLPCLRSINAEKKRQDEALEALRAGAKSMELHACRRRLEESRKGDSTRPITPIELELERMRDIPLPDEIPDEYLYKALTTRPARVSRQLKKLE